MYLSHVNLARAMPYAHFSILHPHALFMGIVANCDMRNIGVVHVYIFTHVVYVFIIISIYVHVTCINDEEIFSFIRIFSLEIILHVFFFFCALGNALNCS